MTDKLIKIFTPNGNYCFVNLNCIEAMIPQQNGCKLMLKSGEYITAECDWKLLMKQLNTMFDAND